MQVVILGLPDSWHVQQLAAAGEALGHAVRVVPFQRLTGLLGGRRAELRVGDFDLLAADGVAVRGIPPGTLEQVVFRMDALHRLQAAGVPVLNPPAAIEACVDKYLATARLQAAGLPVPRTAVCEDLDEAMAAFAALGGDVVVKPLFGSEGRGMLRIEDESLAYRVLRTLVKTGGVLYLQEHVPHPGGDVRALVLGGRVLAGMRRWSDADFRTNVSRGGRFERWDLPPAWQELAVRAAAAVGAVVAGVDLLAGPDGQPLVLEVNSTPGFQALVQTTAVPVPHEIMACLAAMAGNARQGRPPGVP
jgi:ribosomal protein S6--L-glutamate ligase